MITPQDIREKTFEKAVFGGYDMGAVDAFMDEMANDLTLLQKENATLKGKMKVLVSKVEEYRENEDALRMAVLSAQKLGCMIENEAKEKADKTISDAMGEAVRITQEANLEVSAEKARLSESKTESAKFIESMELLCRHQLDFLEKVKTMDFMQQYRAAQASVEPSEVQPAEEEHVEIHETVKSIEETVAKVAAEPVSEVRPDFTPAVAEDELPTRAFSIVSDPEDDVDKTTLFSLNDLQ